MAPILFFIFCTIKSSTEFYSTINAFILTPHAVKVIQDQFAGLPDYTMARLICLPLLAIFSSFRLYATARKLLLPLPAVKQTIRRRFMECPDDTTHEALYYGPMNTLLSDIFKTSEGFQVIPQSHTSGRKSIDFEVQHSKLSVFYVEDKAPSRLRTRSARLDAEKQMKKRMRELRSRCQLPILYGFSAFGSHFRVYHSYAPFTTMQSTTQSLEMDQWEFDIRDKNDSRRIQSVLEEVKAMVVAAAAHS